MILNLFKSKPKLDQLIPNGFVDIHSHILPGIDDGASDIKASVLMIEEMRKLGFKDIIATPHIFPGVHNNTVESISNSYLKIKHEISKYMRISYASEYMIDKSLIAKAKEKQLLTIKDNFVLIEMSYMAEPCNLYEIIYELKMNGYEPILAHPERYSFLHNNFKKYLKLKNAGCYMQMNLLSSTGYYGSNVTKIVNKLLKNNLIDFVGSDAHNLRHLREFKKKIIIDEVEELKKCIENNFKFKIS